MKNIKLSKYLALFIFFSFQLSSLIGQQAPEIMWDKTFGESVYDSLFSMQQTSDGGYILAGTLGDPTWLETSDVNDDYQDYWIIKLDGTGSKVWDKNFGGSFDDRATSIQQTSDGGYIVGGSSRTRAIDGGNPECLIVKLDADGNKVWDKILSGSSADQLNSIQQTSDGGYVVAGSTTSNDGDVSDGNNGSWDYWVVKLDADGNKVWDKTFGGSLADQLNSIQQTADGGYVLAGSTKSDDGDVGDGNNGAMDYWIVKLDGSGNKVWDKTYGGSKSDLVNSIQQTSDGGYIVSGHTWSDDGDLSDGNNGENDYWIIKLDNVGNKVWDKTYGGSGNDYATSIQQTSDGGYIVAGTTSSSDGDITDVNNGGSDCWIIKLDESGNKVWDKTLGGSDSDNATSIQQNSEGGYIIAGYVKSSDGDITDGNNGGYDFWLIKLGTETPSNVNKIETENMFSLYPNPAKSQVIVKTNALEALEQVLITDMTGKIVKQFETQKSTTEIDVSNLVNGIYFVKAAGVSQKLVKK